MRKHEEFTGYSRLDPLQKEALLQRVAETARESEIKYWGCSQAVLYAIQTHLGLESSDTFRAASALAGGIAGNREACGALIGGVLAIGLAYGRQGYEDGKIALEQPEMVECTARAKEYCDRFREQFGGLRCSEVREHMGFNSETRTTNLTLETLKEHDHCGQVTGPAARFAAEVIFQPSEQYSVAVRAVIDNMRKLRSSDSP
jgi:C_GCAxxG_C_C family probable redox protein